MTMIPMDLLVLWLLKKVLEFPQFWGWLLVYIDITNETPYFMDSILDIQLSEAEEIERWEDGAEIFGFASYVNDTATGMAA